MGLSIGQSKGELFMELLIVYSKGKLYWILNSLIEK